MVPNCHSQEYWGIGLGSGLCSARVGCEIRNLSVGCHSFNSSPKAITRKDSHVSNATRSLRPRPSSTASSKTASGKTAKRKLRPSTSAPCPHPPTPRSSWSSKQNSMEANTVFLGGELP